jgi:Zn-finger nucleic acid-binding protein
MSELLCPTDGTALRRIERSGVQVDACPTCRGVWFDRGELDKIVERERSDLDDFEQEIRGKPDSERGSSDVGQAKPHKKKKRSSFFEEFLDFG